MPITKSFPMIVTNHEELLNLDLGSSDTYTIEWTQISRKHTSHIKKNVANRSILSTGKSPMCLKKKYNKSFCYKLSLNLHMHQNSCSSGHGVRTICLNKSGKPLNYEVNLQHNLCYWIKITSKSLKKAFSKFNVLLHNYFNILKLRNRKLCFWETMRGTAFPIKIIISQIF